MTKPNDLLLLRANLKQLRLPTIGAEFEKLARKATASNQTFEQYLLRLTEWEVATRQPGALSTRIRQAHFSVEKDLESRRGRFVLRVVCPVPQRISTDGSTARPASSGGLLVGPCGEPAEGLGTGPLRMDLRAVQCVPGGSARERAKRIWPFHGAWQRPGTDTESVSSSRLRW